MKPTGNEMQYVCDRSRMRNAPPHGPSHWLFAALLMTAVAGALWQHGHAGLTIGLLAAIPLFAASVYLPYRWVSSLVRSIANCFVFGGAVGWAAWRMSGNFTDLILVESLCIAALIFIAGGKPKDCFYLFFISIFLLIYGALVPRMAHLYFTGGAVILLLILAFAFRSTSLAGRPPVREIPSRPLRRWHPAVIQLVLSGFFFWYIFALMPLRNNELPGLFETSFLTTRDTMLPPEISAWLRPKKIRIDANAKMVYSGETAEKPSEAGEKGPAADLPDPVSKSIIEGAGNASSGQDLVFHVKSDVKLYHLAKLYDLYDGTQWKASARLNRIRIREYGAKAGVRDHIVDQKYTIVKLISKHLYSGFRGCSFASEDVSQVSFNRNLKTSFYGAELLKEPAELPFSYVTSVQLLLPLRMPELQNSAPSPGSPTVSEKKGGKNRKRPVPDHAWNENIPKQNYLILPRKKISKRVRTLAAEITAGNLTPYGKALALRDYLRNNYPYKLEAEKVPPGKEPADYFLFELKEGHCEYFACALAVLARAAGLPARVATGFSPGNFNTLSNLFEVYEYHAHAWTQIYIDQLGWLTMDATPPSSLESRTLPAGLGRLRDPFDEEWRITPPELTEKTQEFLKADLLAKARNKEELSPIDSSLVKMVKVQEQLQEKVKEKYSSAMEKVNKSNQDGFLFRIKLLWSRFSGFFRNTFSSLWDLVFSSWLIIVSSVLLAAACFRFIRLWLVRRRLKSKSDRIRRLRREAETLLEKNPEQAVLNIYAALRFALELADLDRGTLELLDFSDRLAQVDRNLSESARVIFLLYYQAEYGSKPLTPADAARAVSLYDSIQQTPKGRS